MYFQVKITLNCNRYHTLKHPLNNSSYYAYISYSQEVNEQRDPEPRLVDKLYFLTWNTTGFNSFTDKFCRCLHQQSIDTYVTKRLTDRNGLSKKLLSVIYRLSVSLSVINILMNLHTKKAYQIFFLRSNTINLK